MKSSTKLTTDRQSIVSTAPGSGESTVAEPLAAAERHRRISERAYFRAAARGFVGDLQIEDWLLAEREVDAMAVSSHGQPAQQPHLDQNPHDNPALANAGRT
jgi:Protein of unknown function (DUF2934)